jgi:hypothetical protein
MTGKTRGPRKAPRSALTSRRSNVVLLGLTLIVTGACVGAHQGGQLSEQARTALLSMAGISSGEDQLRQERAFVAEVESHISTCMASAGFNHIPVPDSSVVVGNAMDFSSHYTIEYAIDHGFGSSTAFPPPVSLLSDVVSRNARYYDALAPAARLNFDHIYQKCSDDSGRDARQALGYVDASVAFDKVESRILGATSYAQAVRDWSACASKAGFQFDSFAQAKSIYKKRVLALSSADRFATPLSRNLSLLQAEERDTASKVKDCTVSFGLVLATLYNGEISKL